MDNPSSNEKFITANAHRIKCKDKIKNLKLLLQDWDPTIVYVQEIGIFTAMEVFKPDFQVYINFEEDAMEKDGIGIATLVKEGVNVTDLIIGEEGRTIGLKTGDAQFWNIYPKSGSGERIWREKYFRETLPNMMMNWKDHTTFVNLGGDVNCTHRLQDSENNQKQHFQSGLHHYLKTFGLQDDYVRLRGDENPVSFSRITNRSKTRIDILTSNLDLCRNFRYWETGIPGYDHKFGIAEYDIQVSAPKEFIPKERRHWGWAFPKELEHDKKFLERAEDICKTVQMEIEWQEGENLEVDMTKEWNYMKKGFIYEAKIRSRELREEEEGRKNALQAFLRVSMKKIENGIDDFQNFKKIRLELGKLWQKRIKRIVDQNKTTEIDDHVFDIHKVEKQKKFVNNSKIRKLKIEGRTFEGTLDILDAMENKIKREVEDPAMDMEGEPTDEEMEFLQELEGLLMMSDEEKEELLSSVTEEECEEIFKEQVNLDSSPGPDGCTYRLYYCLFRKIPLFKDLFARLINWTLKFSSLGELQNIGNLKVINKKRFSEEYDGKRKLMLVNKDVNFIGKLWVNRFKGCVLVKCLPKNQYNCQEDINIVDENREIRDVVRYLRGDDDGEEKDGTLLAIDFRDAFRSVFLRWFKLVLEYLGVPKQFREWFWSFYKDLSIVIVINGATSGKILVKRGFMEGHCPSMAAFVTAVIPLLNCLEKSVQGIKINEYSNRKKLFGFADDLKLTLRNAEEINTVYNVITKFQKVSGLSMHMDPSRQKCHALCFGSHRNYQHWPVWISCKDVVNILGILYSNVKEKTLEQVNSENVWNKVLKKLYAATGIRGTVIQKTIYANVFLLSKVWYVAQSIILDPKMLMELDKKINNFIFAGENERPVRAIVYRSRVNAGLQLICVMTQARALMAKGMLQQQMERDSLVNTDGTVYGNKDDLRKLLGELLSSTENFGSVKSIYSFLLQEKIGAKEDLKPSRAEKKNPQIDWTIAGKNWKTLRGVTPEIKCFAWKLLQDMLDIPSRHNRRGQSKECSTWVYDEQINQMDICRNFGDIKHYFADCGAVKSKFEAWMVLLGRFLGKEIQPEEALTISFQHNIKKKMKMAVWGTIMALFFIYKHRESSSAAMLDFISKELFWHQNLERWWCGRAHMNKLSEDLRRMMTDLDNS